MAPGTPVHSYVTHVQALLSLVTIYGKDIITTHGCVCTYKHIRINIKLWLEN